MGNERKTVQGLEVMVADAERNLLVVKGAVPGGNNGILIITKSVKGK
jgi:large subunit ribosomal protein L3